MAKQTNIWVISDGKAGHESQSVGLAIAIASRTGGAIRTIRSDLYPGPLGTRFAKPPGLDELGPPAIVLGAGSGTLAMIRAVGRRYGARTIVLMRPSWGRYDLVVAPQHDGLRDGPKVITTRGAITMVRPSSSKDATKGFILVGGPSKHHGWDDRAMVVQVLSIVEKTPDVAWALTTSRRTPVEFLELLRSSVSPAIRERIELFPVEATSQGWLYERYKECATIWVSEDSVSMKFEALTSSATVGLLRVPRVGKGSRVIRGVDALVREGFATWFEEWERTGVLKAPPEPLDEASRVAEIVIDRLRLPRSAP